MATYSGEATYESFIAGTALTHVQMHAVALNGTASTHGAEVEVADSANGPVLGVLVNKPPAKTAASVQTTGIAKVVAGGTVTVGEWLVANSEGKVVSAGTATTNILGLAYEGATFDGQVISALLNPTVGSV